MPDEPQEPEFYPIERPALRAVELIPADAGGGQQVLLVRDPAGILQGTVALSMNPLVMMFIQMANGQTTLDEMATMVTRATGHIIGADTFRQVAEKLDEALLLQSERFVRVLGERKAQYLASPVRPSAVFRAEGADRLALIKDLSDEMRRHRSADGAPPADLGLPPASVLGVLAPHIDYMRGGPAYAWAYRALRENGPGARTFIVLGTCHQPTAARFIATSKTFDTPLGQVETDTATLDALTAAYGRDLFDEEFAHANEHTIELQAVYLRHIYADALSVPRIVPVLVGGFEDLLAEGRAPGDDEEITAFCAALRRILDEAGDNVGLIAGVDLSHCGPQFGDEEFNDPERVKAIEAGDRAILAAIESGDPDRFFAAFSDDMNATHVCSVAPIYCAMAAMRGRATPRVLSYQQANSDDQSCLVSFASVAFVRNGARKATIIEIAR